MSVQHDSLNIFTDGSSYPNPTRHGGFGMVFVFPENLEKEELKICPYGYRKATNNQMELKACSVALLESLKLEKEWQRIIIHTDSSYVCDNYQRAIFQWSKNKWLKSSGAPVLNMELWKELIKSIQKVKIRVEIHWVKGHSKNKHNKIADKLAKTSAKKAIKGPLYFVSLRRKKTKEKLEVGSVKILGQKLTIRIITGQSLKQNINKYTFEVMSKKSPFYKKMDIIYSKKTLRTGHEFYVRVNNNQNYPQIIKIYKDNTRDIK